MHNSVRHIITRDLVIRIYTISIFILDYLERHRTSLVRLVDVFRIRNFLKY